MKPVFQTVEEARRALVSDALGTVYVTAQKVFVATAFGTGTFDRRLWEDEGRDAEKQQQA